MSMAPIEFRGVRAGDEDGQGAVPGPGLEWMLSASATDARVLRRSGLVRHVEKRDRARQLLPEKRHPRVRLRAQAFGRSSNSLPGPVERAGREHVAHPLARTFVTMGLGEVRTREPVPRPQAASSRRTRGPAPPGSGARSGGTRRRDCARDTARADALGNRPSRACCSRRAARSRAPRARRAPGGSRRRRRSRSSRDRCRPRARRRDVDLDPDRLVLVGADGNGQAAAARRACSRAPAARASSRSDRRALRPTRGRTPRTHATACPRACSARRRSGSGRPTVSVGSDAGAPVRDALVRRHAVPAAAPTGVPMPAPSASTITWNGQHLVARADQADGPAVPRRVAQRSQGGRALSRSTFSPSLTAQIRRTPAMASVGQSRQRHARRLVRARSPALDVCWLPRTPRGTAADAALQDLRATRARAT